MVIETERFGTLEVDETNVLLFSDGLPGLEQWHKFVLVRDEASDPIEWLQSVEDGGLVLSVIRSFAVLPDYDIEIPDAELSGIGLEDPGDLLVLSVVVIPETIENITANLIAPIVINMRNGAAKQVIIDAKNYSVRVPIFEALMAFVEGGAS